MGHRAQVKIADTGVCLYAHNGAADAEAAVARALDRASDRWGDPPYLTRVIFDELTAGDDSTTGYGIGTVEQVATVLDVTVTVYCADRTVTAAGGRGRASAQPFADLADAAEVAA